MHTITRTIGESLLIDDNIHITILDIRGSQTWIGVSDPEGKLGIGDDASDSGRDPVSAPLLSGDLLTGDRADSLE